MSASHIAGNRNSTPEASSSSLRLPSTRAALNTGHHLRASADMGAYNVANLTSRVIRPSSEVYYSQAQQGHTQGNLEDTADKAAQQWINDIDQYENTLEEMAAATLDQDFKDELSAIEQWFRVLSEAERTAALYALLQQTTQVQIRFFIGVLQQMAKSHPMSGVLSPASFGEKDPMSNRLSTAVNRLSVQGDRNSVGFGRPPASPGNKRNSGLDQSEINSMFPDAAAAIAKQKADFTHQTGTAPTSNRNSTVTLDRTSLVAPTISAPDENRKDTLVQPSQSPWVSRGADNQQTMARPKSSSANQQPMGQFSQPDLFQSSANLRSPRAAPNSADLSVAGNQTGTVDGTNPGMSMLSPYHGSWASMSNTPMVPNFNTQQTSNPADMVANATAMKLAALSTVNNRIQLDDVRKYRRARSSEGQKPPLSPGIQGNNLPSNFLMTNEHGQILTPQQAAALQAQQLAAINGRRSRPSSPAYGLQTTGMNGIGFSNSQNNGFLSAYDGTSNLMNNQTAALNLAHYGTGFGVGEGYLSDASEINRGRSPRGRRGSSKPPEDPTDVELLQDIPNWLRALRLHKYTDNLKDLKWNELVQLDDAGLEKRGVNALGARRKMLKVFEQVREAQAQGKL